ncbi:MAG: archease [Deltaproteobacteria bacterium]|nr:archease [Deltaproteobacteria bacterium]
MSREKSGYRWLDHTADVGVVVHGDSLEALFEIAAEALSDLITDRETVEEREERRVVLSAPDPEQLLVRWLTEILAWFEIDGLVFRRFSVRMDGALSLEGRAFGEAFTYGAADRNARHPFRTAIKAVTYHQLSVRQSGDGWEATIIFDV